MTDKVEKQKELEEESLGLGIRKYREALAQCGEDNLSPGMKLLKAAIEPLTAAIQTCVNGGTFAEFERAMLRERTCNGLETAHKERRRWTTPKTQDTPAAGDHASGQVWTEERGGGCQTIRSPATVSRLLLATKVP
ncbi:hypothetical protein [Nitrosospira sp. Nsp1]|uniref:hypothetical protein n=1 Tax=Nitrosospira sp. Nsp1 TaxID=136547 RepID=UPI00088ADED2|nr:hypothetical protein [Nitrosospira sp. Nsp1]SCX40310.1 hypothetical protein SAMN05720354_10386 [Nitrosospira sp. Nsp1]